MAREYLTSIVGIQPNNITIEEVESTSDGNFWVLTLGYYIPTKLTHISFIIQETKEYKVFKIRKSNGEVVSMKIRQTS